MRVTMVLGVGNSAGIPVEYEKKHTGNSRGTSVIFMFSRGIPQNSMGSHGNPQVPTGYYVKPGVYHESPRDLPWGIPRVPMRISREDPGKTRE